MFATRDTETRESEGPAQTTRSTQGVPRVLVVGPSARDQGGITRAIQSWRDSGLDARADIRVLSTTDWDASRPLQILQTFSALMRLTLRMLNRRTRPDVLHVNTSSGASLYRKTTASAIARLFGVPVIAHLHSGGFADWIEDRRVHRVVSRYLFSMAAYTVVLSSHWVPLAERLDARAVIVIPHLVTPAHLEVLRDRNARSSSSPRPGTGIRLLFFGRWAPVKGLDLIASAIAGLEQHERRRISLRIFGNGDRAWAVDCFAGIDLASIEILGWLYDEDKRLELNLASAVLAPSRAEAFGASLLEVMAAGRPIITSDAGAIPDVVHGYPLLRTVTAGDVHGLRSAIRDLLNGTWPPPDASATLPERFLPHTVVNDIADLYVTVAAQSRCVAANLPGA